MNGCWQFYNGQVEPSPRCPADCRWNALRESLICCFLKSLAPSWRTTGEAQFWLLISCREVLFERRPFIPFLLFFSYSNMVIIITSIDKWVQCAKLEKMTSHGLQVLLHEKLLLSCFWFFFSFGTWISLPLDPVWMCNQWIDWCNLIAGRERKQGQREGCDVEQGFPGQESNHCSYLIDMRTICGLDGDDTYEKPDET